MAGLPQIIKFFITAPLFLYRFSFCPFRLPYLYCFICPVRCLWYQIRGWVLLIALGLSIRKDLFCAQLCPFGTIQILLSKISPKKISLPRFFYSFKYIGVAVIALIIATTRMPQLSAYRFMGLSLNQISIVKMRGLLLGILLLGMALSIFNYQFFCHNLCPTKALSRITHFLFWKTSRQRL